LCAKAANHEPLVGPLSEVESISDTVNSQGIVVAARWNDIKPDIFLPAKKAVIIAIDRVADPGNIGTIIRTAAWFGVTGVMLGDGCADLLNPKTVRSTMGAIFQIPICRNVKLPEELPKLKMQGYKIAAATLGGSPEWRNWGAAEKSILVLGSEAHGISREVLAISDIQVTIPRRGIGESLNVAVSAGILLSALPEDSRA
jgi:RNA methyltransferase, TrmH family